MMSDDIEAMARAICAAKGINPDEKIFFADSNHVRRLRWTDWIPHAEGAYEALRASGRLAPAVEGDAVDMALEAAGLAVEKASPHDDDIVVAVRAVYSIIAAATEERVREECAKACEAEAVEFDPNTEFQEGWSKACLYIAENLRRTGATR